MKEGEILATELRLHKQDSRDGKGLGNYKASSLQLRHLNTVSWMDWVHRILLVCLFFSQIASGS